MRSTVRAVCLLMIASAITGCVGGPNLGTLPPALPHADMPTPFDTPLRTVRPNPDFHPPGVLGMRLLGVGTGFFIARNKFLTNFHVVRPCTAVTVGNNREGKEIMARYDYGDPQKDLAVLTTAPIDVRPARFESMIAPESAQDLSIVGYPAVGLPTLIAELDKVAAVPGDLVKEEQLYPFSGNVHAGNSGSPVLNNRGAVVGVVAAKINTTRIFEATGMIVKDIGFAIPNRAVLDFLDQNEISYLRADATKALSTDEVLAEAHGFVRQVGCWG